MTADRGFADVELCDLLDSYRVEYVIRAKGTTKVQVAGEWRQLQTISFVTNSRRRNGPSKGHFLGHVQYCESDPHPLWVSLSRVKNEKGDWEVWYLISNRWQNAAQMAGEYARRFGCEQGFRDAKRLLGFADARIEDIHAWSRFFALFALALLILVSLAVAVQVARCGAILRDPEVTAGLLRRIASRRRGRYELSLINAMVKLLEQDSGLFFWLDAHCLLDLEASFSNVS